MNKYKILVDFLKQDPNFDIKYVHYWIETGTVDSVLFDKYEDASKDLNDKYTKAVPIIIEKQI